MTRLTLFRLGLVTSAMCIGSTASAEFNFDGDCTGAGDFTQEIRRNAVVTVGTIPAGTENLRVDLKSPEDVDIQLVDLSNGTEIAAWPNGLMNGPGSECRSYAGAEICYSGYNGVNGELGDEYIEVKGAATVDLEMRAFGYAAGQADVNYTWDPNNTCNEAGTGSFEQYIPYRRSVVVGTLPVGTPSVSIELKAGADVDVQLIDTDNNVNIIAWAPTEADMGLLNGPTKDCAIYKDLKYCYSGYNGIDGQKGWETIDILGASNVNLEMRAYGYQSGNATVEYEWAVGAGQICGSRGLQPCKPGLICKNGDHGNIAVDRPGQCHTENWCESDQSAADDCKNLFHPAVPGRWGCNEFQCSWVTTIPGNGELGGFCGGIAALPCNAGLVCEITASYPDAAGVCVEGPGIGEPGGMCGGIAGFPCNEGLNCDIQETYPDAAGTCNQQSCADLSGVDLGLCEMLLGWTPDQDTGECVPKSGCSNGGYSFYASKAECEAECTPTVCPAHYDPVCGMDDKTYGNSCAAGVANMAIAHHGECVDGASGAGGTCGGFVGQQCEEGLHCNITSGSLGFCCPGAAQICDAACNGGPMPPVIDGCPMPGCMCPENAP